VQRFHRGGRLVQHAAGGRQVAGALAAAAPRVPQADKGHVLVVQKVQRVHDEDDAGVLERPGVAVEA
jgi:hypothetical protein